MADRHGDVVIGRLDRDFAVTCTLLERQDDQALMPAPGQRPRERTGDIGQTTRLGEAHDFGGGVQNDHCDGISRVMGRSVPSIRPTLSY